MMDHLSFDELIVYYKYSFKGFEREARLSGISVAGFMNGIDPFTDEKRKSTRQELQERRMKQSPDLAAFKARFGDQIRHPPPGEPPS